jgi:hypothetical protein
VTPEQVREEAAKRAEDLEQRWRRSAVRLRERYAKLWFGGANLRRDASTLEEAANGLAAVAHVIRLIDTTQ